MKSYRRQRHHVRFFKIHQDSNSKFNYNENNHQCSTTKNVNLDFYVNNASAEMRKLDK